MCAEKIAVFRRNNPNRDADEIGGETDARLKKINNRQGQDHPDQNEAGEVALDLVGLTDECDRGADGRDVEDRGGLTPPGRSASADQNENSEGLAQDQRRERDRAPNGTAQKI